MEGEYADGGIAPMRTKRPLAGFRVVLLLLSASSKSAIILFTTRSASSTGSANCFICATAALCPSCHRLTFGPNVSLILSCIGLMTVARNSPATR